MSRAGTKANQGGDFQIAIAIHWVIRLLSDQNIDYIQAESNGILGFSAKITVDDIVIVHKEGYRYYIQAKKNQSTNRSWTFADLGEELLKCKEQLHSDNTATIYFYSATPFGDFQSLAEACGEYPDFSAFQCAAGNKQNDSLTHLAEKWQESVQNSFDLVKRVKFGSHFNFEEWKRQNLQELKRLVTKPETALAILESFVNSHQSKQTGTNFEIRREQILAELRKHGVISAPTYVTQEILDKFTEISRIGRDWNRTVGGQQITRPELTSVIQNIEQRKSTILIVDRPGSGKTCLLLDIAEHLESDDEKVLLFLKGDRFIDAETRKILPTDLVEMCARLAESRHLIIVIDSLDVLSLSRDSGGLSYFLSLIDRLNGLTNITLVVACRSFDLQYDAKLRNREWQQKIELADFDFDKVVAPILSKWRVSASGLSIELKQLLCLPQNLRLFESIANVERGLEVRNAFELQNVFLDECVRKHPDIGASGLKSLQQLAYQLIKLRTHHLPVVQFSAEELTQRSLISQNVLFEDAGKIAFTHQTLFDALVVQHALANGEDLLSFILAHPPFPFLRASVQTFIFHLRTHSPDLFSRQITKTLASDKVAYHLKRLIVETIGTLSIDPLDDWPLVRRIFQQHPSLFERMFWKTTGTGWFRLLLDQWFPLLGDHDQKWRRNFLHHLGQWANDLPEEVTTLRIRAINEQWGNENTLDTIIWQLEQFTEWSNKKIYPLLELISQEIRSLHEIDQHGDFLNTLAKYVTATGQGYDLLWQFMTRKVTNESISRFELQRQLDCNFQNENILQQALKNSNHFLALVLQSLTTWAYREKSIGKYLNTAFVHSCPSYNRMHSQSEYPFSSSADLGSLLQALEAAIYHHAKEETSWWQENEPQLRNSNLSIILYFLITPYSEFSEKYADGISTLLTNPELLRYGHLDYELGELMQVSYPALSEQSQLKNQKIILSLYENNEWRELHGYVDELPLWVYRNQYYYLLRIPVIYRSLESQTFIERYTHDFGSFLPEPEIISRGGMVGCPLTLEQMQSLSDMALIKYCKHYEGYGDTDDNHPADYLRGGQGQVQHLLSEATAYDPERYLKLIPLFISSELDIGYAQNIVHGVASHIRYRFGNVKPSSGEFKWKKPEVDGEWLAVKLLDLLESAKWLWADTGHFNLFSIPEACCDVLTDKKQTERLVFILFQLLFQLRRNQVGRNTDQLLDNTYGHALRFDAINSDWGHIGSGVAKLCNRLLEAEHEIPELLYPLLCHLVKTSKQAAMTVIDYIPYMTYKKPEWGFQLFSVIYDAEVPACPWGLAQQHLYYQYHDNFEYTAPYLERMLQSGETTAIQGWGRLSTMCHLAGHLTQDQLFEQLKKVNKEEAWIAAAQVFEANIDKYNRDGLCINGMTRILELELGMPRVISEIEDVFDPKTHGCYVGNDFVRLYIEKANFKEERWSIKHLLDWLAVLSIRDPLASLELLEILADKLSAESTRRLYEGKSLIQALNSLLREADETDDGQLINRVIGLQDRFLQLDLYGIEDFFNAAGRS